MYPDTELHIAGRWRAGADRDTLGVLNPATGETIGQCAVATTADLDEALGRERAHRLTQRHATDSEHLGQLALRRQLLSRPEVLGLDQPADVVRDARIERRAGGRRERRRPRGRGTAQDAKTIPRASRAG